MIYDKKNILKDLKVGDRIIYHNKMEEPGYQNITGTILIIDSNVILILLDDSFGTKLYIRSTDDITIITNKENLENV